MKSTTTLFSIDHAAEQLGVSHQTLRNWLKRDEVEPTVLLNGKQPLFSYQDITRIRESRTNGKRD